MIIRFSGLTIKKPPLRRFFYNGADTRTRTADPLITNQLLYQLSYVGITGSVYILKFLGCQYEKLILMVIMKIKNQGLNYYHIKVKRRSHMKKMKYFLGLVLAGAVSSQALAQEAVTQALPQPNIFGGIAVMEALNNRHSGKSFGLNTLDNQTLSEILWAAWGVNRDDGKRTVPTAMNRQDMQVYVIQSDGAWLYNAPDNNLQQVTNKDLRGYLQTQDYTDNAPLFLLYTTTGDPADMNTAMQAGSMYQNVALYCAARGLNNVVRGYYQKEDLAAALGIDADTVIISQVVGYPI